MPYPLLKAFDAFVVALLDLGLYAAERSVGEERLRRLSHGYGCYGEWRASAFRAPDRERVHIFYTSRT